MVVTLSLPPYAYVPGHWPHPTRDAAGHGHGQASDSGDVTPITEPWWNDARFRRGITLFDAGYYWEAHEVWEGLWIAAGRRGPVADLVGAFIKIAAAGVKLRQHRRASAAKLGARARDGLASLPENFDHERVAALLDETAAPRVTVGPPTAAVQVVFTTSLHHIVRQVGGT